MKPISLILLFLGAAAASHCMFENTTSLSLEENAIKDIDRTFETALQLGAVLFFYVNPVFSLIAVACYILFRPAH
jgi:hypothetical protein